MIRALEELKKLANDSTDFQRGFNTAINIVIALNKSDEDEMAELRREIAKLQLRIAKLECDKQPYRWYPYVTYCDSANHATNGTIYKGTTVSSNTKTID